MNAQELTYPDSPDAKGYAKRYYKRRAFYFGQHNSPESLILFGTWKKILLETGEAPEVREVKRQLTAYEKQEFERQRRRGWFLPALIGAAFFVVTCSAVISFKLSAPRVDGELLSQNEMEVIRGIRIHQNAKASQRARSTRVADLTLKLLNEDPRNGQIFHQRPSS